MGNEIRMRQQDAPAQVPSAGSVYTMYGCFVTTGMNSSALFDCSSSFLVGKKYSVMLISLSLYPFLSIYSSLFLSTYLSLSIYNMLFLYISTRLSLFICFSLSISYYKSVYLTLLSNIQGSH